MQKKMRRGSTAYKMVMQNIKNEELINALPIKD